MKDIFIECYSLEDCEILKRYGFTFLDNQSSVEKYVFLNDGTLEFSNNENLGKIKTHSRANV